MLERKIWAPGDFPKAIMIKRDRKTSQQEEWANRIEKLPSLAKLEARLVSNCTAVQTAREDLIEELGRHICGEGDGPTSKDLCAFKHINRIGEKIRRDMADHLNLPLMERLIRSGKKDGA